MKIEAVARDMQTATNKRNIALFQRHMEQALGIPASRGYLRFVPVAEDCAGWKGNTIAGEIADAKDRTHVVSERWGSIRAPRRKSSKVSPVRDHTVMQNLVLNKLSIGISRIEKQNNDVNRDSYIAAD
ncbi:hypothetical protein ACLX1H_008470 [Fusarium chlamydosporum]